MKLKQEIIEELKVKFEPYVLINTHLAWEIFNCVESHIKEIIIDIAENEKVGANKDDDRADRAYDKAIDDVILAINEQEGL